MEDANSKRCDCALCRLIDERGVVPDSVYRMVADIRRQQLHEFSREILDKTNTFPERGFWKSHYTCVHDAVATTSLVFAAEKVFDVLVMNQPRNHMFETIKKLLQQYNSENEFVYVFSIDKDLQDQSISDTEMNYSENSAGPTFWSAYIVSKYGYLHQMRSDKHQCSFEEKLIQLEILSPREQTEAKK
jgi:ribosomal protein S24E